MGEDTVCICAIEYHSAIKTDENLPSSAMWMDLKNTMLVGISQTEKDKYCVRSHVESKKYLNEVK